MGSSTTWASATQKQQKQEDKTLDSGVSEVLDLLYFDTNDNSKNNAKKDEIKNDAFYAFDFGQNDNNNKNKLIHQKSHQSSSSDSYSSSDEQFESSDDEKEKENKANDNDLKLMPPKKQSSRTKKRRVSKQLSAKSKNERAFNKLHQKFDPSLLGKDGAVNSMSPTTATGNEKKKVMNEKKRNTEPASIHSERQQQLKEEGLINSKSNNKKNDNQSSNNKNKKKKSNKKSLYNVLPELHRGTALLKYGRRGYPHFRQFNLTADNEHIRWFSTKKKLQQSSINVGDINEILTGQHTKEFRRIAWTTLTPASFSIIYQNKKKSLNLVAKSVDEMKMWVDALRRLRDMKKKGESLKKLEKLEVEVDFRDRNRPQSRNHSGNFLRSHETKERQVDPILQKKLIDDIAVLRKTYIEISREANNPIVQSTKEYESIEQILSELEERVEELDHEVR